MNDISVASNHVIMSRMMQCAKNSGLCRVSPLLWDKKQRPQALHVDCGASGLHLATDTMRLRSVKKNNRQTPSLLQ